LGETLVRYGDVGNLIPSSSITTALRPQLYEESKAKAFINHKTFSHKRKVLMQYISICRWKYKD